MSFSTGQPSALAIFSIACSSIETGWNSLPPPLLSMNALAALSELHTTTGSGETPGIWTQIGTPSDLYIADGELPRLARPAVPGHEVVGEVIERGERAERFSIGQRVGVPWLGW